MRLILRIIGTWLIGLALILIVIDGIKSLGANSVVLTPLAQSWVMFGPGGMDAVRDFVGTRFFGSFLGPAFENLLDVPTFFVVGVPGVLIALLGRARSLSRYVRQDRI